MRRSGLNPPVSRNPWVWVGFLLCLTLGVPWYLPDSTERSFLGLPIWVEICLAGNLVLSVYTAWAIHRFWRPGDD